MKTKKICTRCKTEKALDDFYISKKKSWFRSDCKVCGSLRNKFYYYQKSLKIGSVVEVKAPKIKVNLIERIKRFILWL